LGRLGWGMVYDLTIAGAALIMLARGPQSGVLRSGLWIVPPTLLAVCAVSTAVSALAWFDAYLPLVASPPAPAAYLAKPRRDGARFVSWLLLMVLLGAVEFGRTELRRRAFSPPVMLRGTSCSGAQRRLKPTFR